MLSVGLTCRAWSLKPKFPRNNLVGEPAFADGEGADKDAVPADLIPERANGRLGPVEAFEYLSEDAAFPEDLTRFQYGFPGPGIVCGPMAYQD